MAVTPNTFRLQGKYIMLTYPKSNFPLHELLDFLKTIFFGRNRPVYIVVSSEKHADGTLHRHAFIQYSGRVDIRNQTRFDFQGRHPNMLKRDNPTGATAYVKKDGTWLDWGEEPSPSSDIYDLAKSHSYPEFFEHCRSQRVPAMYAQLAWNYVHGDQTHITIDEDPNPDLCITLPEELSTFNFSTELTNVLVGPSGIGKTILCLRAMKKPILFVTHVDQLKTFDPGCHRSILFDDMKFDHWAVQSQIHLCDRILPRAIHRRYGTTLIPSGTQVTITCNERPFAYHAAINRRINFIQI